MGNKSVWLRIILMSPDVTKDDSSMKWKLFVGNFDALISRP